ncbi:hypothetical protein Tco_0824639 [Tanacetum coccineum]|uniref:Uncharacterized protein n=1 Tax=Tanacetum coccineum TaxID=301880 RepID=A0ABQ5ALB6_9ASTR
MKNVIEHKINPIVENLATDVDEFYRFLKEEMVEGLKYFNSFEKEIESLNSQLELQRTQFSNKIDRLSGELVCTKYLTKGQKQGKTDKTEHGYGMSMRNQSQRRTHFLWTNPGPFNGPGGLIEGPGLDIKGASQWLEASSPSYKELPAKGGIPRSIVLGYDGLPLQPVAPPSPDYILGPENLQILPVPQDEDEREPMFIQAHDPDYVPEPIYPEYIPLEDDHEFPAEEQPLPPIDSPTTEPFDLPKDGGDDETMEMMMTGDSSRMTPGMRMKDEEDEEDEEEVGALTPSDLLTV